MGKSWVDPTWKGGGAPGGRNSRSFSSPCSHFLCPSRATFHPRSVCSGREALCFQDIGLRGPFQLKSLWLCTSLPGEMVCKSSTVQSSTAAAASWCWACCEAPGSFQPFSLVNAESVGTWMMLTIQPVFQAVKCLLILFVLVCKSGCNYDTEHIYYPVGERCKVWLNAMN